MSLGFEPSVGQILPNQTGKTKDSKQEEEFPDPSPQSWEQPAVSSLTVCCDVNVSPHGTTGNQTYSEGLRLDYVMKTTGSSWSDGCLFVSGVDLIFQERGKLKITTFICSYVKHTAASPACTDLYTWDHSCRHSFNYNIQRVSANHWGRLFNVGGFHTVLTACVFIFFSLWSDSEL